MNHAPLETLSDDELHASVRRLTARSNITLADFLAHLGEVETRGIHRNRACATLYTYCLYELRLSEDAAYRRSKAARLVHLHPDLHGVLARGELHLTGLLMVAPYLGGERHAEILERARFRSKREIARLIAEINPRPEVAPRIEPVAPAAPRPATHAAFVEALAGPVRSLPLGDRPRDWMPADRVEVGDVGTKHGAPDGLADHELAEAERALDGAWEARRGAPPRRPLRYVVQFTADQEYVDLLEEAQDLLGCKKKAAGLPDVQLRALRELVERLRKRRTGTRSAAREGWTSESAGRAVDDEPEKAATPGSTAPARVVAGEAGEAETSLSTASARVVAGEAGEAEGSLSTVPARVVAGEAGEAEASLSTAPARVVDDEPEKAATPGSTAPARVVAGEAGESETSLSAAPAQDQSSRYIPVAVRRAVWARDGSRCAYRDERGRRCAETRGLEVHHREAHEWGGPRTVLNLELRCAAHNTLAAEQDFGRAHVDRMRGTERGS